MRKILIVEDEEVLRETYGLILSTEPYAISVAADGGEALKLCETIMFDLILLDLMMPKVDGLAFLERFNQMDKPMPTIIVLSNLSPGDEINKALSLGARKSVIKADVSPKQLLSLVRYELQST